MENMTPDGSHQQRANASSRQTISANRAARQLTMQCLHQIDVQNGANLEHIESFLQQQETLPQARDLAQQWTRQAWRDHQQLDELITAVSTNWRLDRISIVDRSILRLSVYHLLHGAEFGLDAKLTINEVVELAKEYGAEQSPAFINGVLDAINRRLKTAP